MDGVALHPGDRGYSDHTRFYVRSAAGSISSGWRYTHDRRLWSVCVYDAALRRHVSEDQRLVMDDFGSLVGVTIAAATESAT